jgi:hypothetical protein
MTSATVQSALVLDHHVNIGRSRRTERACGRRLAWAGIVLFVTSRIATLEQQLVAIAIVPVIPR